MPLGRIMQRRKRWDYNCKQAVQGKHPSGSDIRVKTWRREGNQVNIWRIRIVDTVKRLAKALKQGHYQPLWETEEASVAQVEGVRKKVVAVEVK